MNLIQRMLAAADSPFAPYLSYIKVRSSNPGKWLFILEGFEDVPFYQAQVQQIDASFNFVPIVVSGKANVLDVRFLMRAKRGATDDKVSFFVDHDFDQLRGHPAGEDIYVTPTYSIENLCCTELVFQRIMEGEFKLDADEAVADLPRLLELFVRRREELIVALADAHALLYKGRTTGSPAIGGIDNGVKKYVKISTDLVAPSADRAALVKLLGLKEAPSQEDFERGHAGFSALDPIMFSRGKFLYGFFVELLKLLKEDRCATSPRVFAKKRSISFTPEAEQVRVFASCAAPTECLRRFIERLTGASLILTIAS